MAQGLITESYLSDIASAIRSKNGQSMSYTPSQMASAIQSIVSAGELTIISKVINENGVYPPSSDNADAFSGVVVNVPNTYNISDEGKVVASGSLSEQGTLSITSNSVYDTTLFSQVSVAIPDPVLISKTITENGEYDPASDNADAYSHITVNVSGGGGIGNPFIEGQATTYIDTGVSCNLVYGAYFEFTPITVQNNYQWYIGATENVFTIAAMSMASGITYGFIRCGNIDFGIVRLLSGRKNILSCSNGEVYLNGTKLSGSYSGAINSNTTTIKILGNENQARAHCRIYNLKLYDSNNELFHEFIPSCDSNYIPCLYDMISSSYKYGNNSTLTFGYAS